MSTLTTEYQKIGTGGAQTFGATSARIDLYAKYNSQSIPNNSTNYSIEARLVITSGSYIGDYTGTTLTLSGDNISSTQNKGTGNFGNQTLGNTSGTVTHNTNGTKSISCSASMQFKAWGKTLTVSGSADLPTIPRYATITTFAAAGINETGVSMSFISDATVDYMWYSTNNGSSWTGYDIADGTKGTVVVGSLSANTTYNCKIKVRRKDSQLVSESNTVQAKTYAYPYCTNAPDFTIGNNVTFTFYNPLNRTIKIQLWSYKSGTLVTNLIETSGTSYTGLSNVANSLYASIPNDKKSQYNIDVYYGNNKAIKVGGYYSIRGDETPIFNDFEYEDTDNTVLSLTGNNQILVDNNSDCLFKISSANKAIAQNSSTISKYVVTWGNQTNEITNLTPENLSASCYDGTGNILKVTAVDSRGLSTTVQKTITNIPYKFGFINNLSTQRKDGVDSKTYLAGKFTIYNGSWDGTNAENSQNRLKYVGYSVYTSGAWSNYYDITSDILSVATETVDGNNKIYEFNFGDEIQIHENGTSGGFTIGTEYQIKVLIKDGNNSYIFTPYSYQVLFNTNVSDGTVATCLHKDRNGLYHLGINCMSDDGYMVVTNDIPIVDNDGNLILDLLSNTYGTSNKKGYTQNYINGLHNAVITSKTVSNNDLYFIKIGHLVIVNGRFGSNVQSGSITFPYKTKYNVGCSIVGYFPDNMAAQAYGYGYLNANSQTFSYNANAAFTVAYVNMIYYTDD